MNQTFTTNREGFKPPDDSWWAALLANEEQFDSHAEQPRPAVEKRPPMRPARKTIESAEAKTNLVDWEYAQQLFDSDETVELHVSGYNRGGLLVEGNRLQGFVPLSHLVEVNPDAAQEQKENVMVKYTDRLICLKVIECNPERGRVVFSQRAALAGSGKRNILFDTLKVNERVHGVVTNVTNFGVFLDLGGLEGLIHVSELSWGRVRHPSDVAMVGQSLDALVIHVDRQQSRVALSLKRMCSNPWDSAHERYFPGQIVEAVVTSVVPFGVFARLEDGLDGLIHTSEFDASSQTRALESIQEGQAVRARVIQVDAQRQRLGLSLRLEAETSETG